MAKEKSSQYFLIWEYFKKKTLTQRKHWFHNGFCGSVKTYQINIGD